MEKGALVGMMALAASDFLFCIVTISGTYLPTQIIHIRRNLAFYYTMYGNCINNILIKTSTWFTVILAASRHFAVAHPIKARQYMRCGHTVGAILLCMCLLIALHIPLAYLWEVQTITCPGGGTADVLVSGKFVQNTLVKNTFNYIWFISGFAIPVFILAYCNIRLIYSLKMSTTLRENDEIIHRGSAGRAKQSRDSNQRRISMTLIAIVTMFFLLIFPSEIAHFYEEIAKPGDGFNVVITTCNMLQVINFSANFILYCIVNAYFRKTLRSWIRYLSCRKGQYFSFSGSKRIGSTYSVTMSTKHSIVTQNSNVDNGINQSGISLWKDHERMSVFNGSVCNLQSSGLWCSVKCWGRARLLSLSQTDCLKMPEGFCQMFF